MCNRCPFDFLGPKPGQNIETLLVPTQTCKVYGGANPNRVALADDESWAACADQGVWDAVAFRCVANAGWKLRNTTQEFEGEFILLPDVCRAGSGPPTDATEFEPPFCSRVWAVDPLTGQEDECSGHGLQVRGVCACFADDTNGHWALADVTIQSSRLAYSNPTGSEAALVDDVVVVSTCARCVEGYSLDAGCL